MIGDSDRATGALDKHDPNYDSGDEAVVVANPHVNRLAELKSQVRRLRCVNAA